MESGKIRELSSLLEMDLDQARKVGELATIRAGTGIIVLYFMLSSTYRSKDPSFKVLVEDGPKLC